MNQELNSGETRPENLLNLTDTTHDIRLRPFALRARGLRRDSLRPAPSCGRRLVGDAGLEPVTPTMSR